MTFLEAQKALCRKLNIDFNDITNNDLFSLEDIKEWINLGALKSWDYHRWIFSEKAVYTQTAESKEYYDYPDEFVSDSLTILKVEDENGKMKTYQKIRFEDYQKYLEENEDGNDKVFSDFKRFYFINLNAYGNAGGRKIELWGKIRAPKLVDDTDLLPFSPDTDNEENSGNEAIVRLAYSIALSSEKMKQSNRSSAEEKEAYTMLGVIAGKERTSQAQYQSKDRPFFNVPQLF